MLTRITRDEVSKFRVLVRQDVNELGQRQGGARVVGSTHGMVSS